MSYAGEKVTIPLGDLGLNSDDSPERIAPGGLASAKNLTFERGYLEKAPGSRAWNASALPAGIAGFTEYWPDPYTQRLIAVTKTGKVYRFENRNSSAEVTGASSSEPTTLSLLDGWAAFVKGGQEVEGNDKKLFILTGYSPIQVISGDGTTRENLASPATDWSTNNYPQVGIIHRGRLWAFLGHRGYTSSATDHEDFQDVSNPTFSIYPGDGDRIIAAWIYKGRLFVAKHPYGVFFLVDDDTNSDNWYFAKLQSSFGVASVHSAIEVKDDVWMANADGGLTSASAAQSLGDIESADLLNILRCEKHVRQYMLEEGLTTRSSLYYQKKKQVYLTYQSKGGEEIDRLLVIDVSKQQPRISVWDKDQPNCLGVINDLQGVERPFYGANDGYLYELDRSDRCVIDGSGTASGYRAEFTIPPTFLGVENQKLFDFLEVIFTPTGRWDLSVEVYIDGEYSETITFRLSRGAVLDAFTLDTHRLTGKSPLELKKPLHGTGKTISFRCYNSGTRENIKIQALKVYFRVAGENQKG